MTDVSDTITTSRLTVITRRHDDGNDRSFSVHSPGLNGETGACGSPLVGSAACTSGTGRPIPSQCLPMRPQRTESRAPQSERWRSGTSGATAKQTAQSCTEKDHRDQ